ncbi:MAG: CPBP family intramembrane glutamic endopeptidase [Zavarzinella sp.]
MKELLKYVRDFLKQDFYWPIYLWAAIFLGVSVAINYTEHIKTEYVSYYTGWERALRTMAFYGLAYYAILIPKLFFSKDRRLLLSASMWGRSLLWLAVAGVVYGTTFFRELADQFTGFTGRDLSYLSAVYISWHRVILGLVLIWVLWRVLDRRQAPFMYGFTTRGFHWRLYAVCMILMLPLIAAASFLPAFLEQYPMMKPWKHSGALGWSHSQLLAFYEPSYMARFIAIELIFRGAMIHGVAHKLDRHAVLPMAAAYCFLHFEKPMGEAISSIFGGYFLGVLSLRTGSLFGGICVHMGIALLMDLAAIAQHVRMGML